MTNKKPEIKTWKNLEAAFAGESMAYQKYMYFAKIARKNGDEDVAKLFEETARHETGHAEGHLRNLYPMELMTTEECLKVASEGERFEYTEMYPQYAKTAREEGADAHLIKEFMDGAEECKEHAQIFKAKWDQKRVEKVSKVFNALAKVEQEHYENYKAALDKQPKGKFSVSDDYLKENPNS